LNVEEFGTLTEARIVTEAWRMEYNTYRPHSSLGGLTAAEYARRWAMEHQPALSYRVDQKAGPGDVSGRTRAAL
jgi:hypothetical protein